MTYDLVRGGVEMRPVCFTKSIQFIPQMPGTFWVKASNKELKESIVYVGYSRNVYEAIRVMDKRGWLESDHHSLWVEVLLDEDITLSA